MSVCKLQCTWGVLPAPLDHSLRKWSLYSLHHGEMLLIVMSLYVSTNAQGKAMFTRSKASYCQRAVSAYKHTCDLVQCEAFVVFKQDAANTPHITRVSPTQLCGRVKRGKKTLQKQLNRTDSSRLLPRLNQHLLPSMTSGAR